MQNQHRYKQSNLKKNLLLSLMCVALAGCSAAKTTATLQPIQPSPTQTMPAISTPEPPTKTATVSPTATPQVVVPGKSAGLLVFAMGDGLYTHLFVYGPDSTPITRLTEDNWDDEDPAISPDGTKVAFTSNRDGQWDIYILDLQTDTTQRLTQTKTYDGAPAWSPDGQYLLYETLDDQNLDLIVQSIDNPTAAPIQLTANSGDNFDPAWSPDGHTIAFITNRDGQNELWLADTQSVSDRFKKLVATDQTQYRHPRWSPDGSTLAWCQQDAESTIETLALSQTGSQPIDVGFGCDPVWSDDGSAIMATLAQPNSNYLVAYRLPDKTLLLSPLQTSNEVTTLDWVSSTRSKYLINYINLLNPPTPSLLFSATLTEPTSSTGRTGVVKIDNLNAPQPYLADSTDEAFNALRQGIGEKSDWDFLATLENAYLPLTSTSAPAIIQNWSYTGRAISVNTAPLDAGWMAVSREDYNGQTYWRVWIKCLTQDGSCGKPMQTSIWDFSARFDSDPVAYENGGKLSTIPSGYWIDFTEFAARYGWERLPSQADWRYYYPGTLFNQFAYTQGLNWTEAMLELYPPDAIQSLNNGQ